MLSRYLLSALSFVLVGVALGQDAIGDVAIVGASVIYQDYTSGYTAYLPSGHVLGQDKVYDTSVEKTFRFGVDWAGDSDTVSFTPPSLSKDFAIINEHPTNSKCDLLSSQTSYFITLNSSNPICNYTVSWSAPFHGSMTVAYDASTTTGFSTDSISIDFVSSSITGDPQFVGLRGQQYQVHGIDGAVYNIITEHNTQVNSRFVFLTEGQCPIRNGQADSNCWSHPGSYLGEMSFQQVVDGKLHAALITAGPAKSGFAGVQVDGRVVKVGQTVSYGSFSVTARTAYSVSVQTEHFEFELTNSDMFINQALRSTIALSKLQAHGLLGQTASLQTYPTAIKYIAGAVDDYTVADSDIYGNNFVYNLFQQ
jgi:hypothetical protein